MLKVQRCPSVAKLPGSARNSTMSTQGEKNVEAFESIVKVAAHGGGRPMSWHGLFKLGPIKPAAGSWYFGVECPNCRRITSAFRDFSDGKLGNPFFGSGEIRLECYSCGREISARALQIVTLRWQ
jgi:ribosomal protein S27E